MGSEFVGRNSSKSANKSNTTASLFNERPFFTPNREDNIENKQKFFKGVSSPDYFFSVGVNSPTPTIQTQEDNSEQKEVEQEPDISLKSDRTTIVDNEETLDNQSVQTKLTVGKPGDIQRQFVDGKGIWANCSETTCKPDPENHPLIYHCNLASQVGRRLEERCKRPAVGYAQKLLNKFLEGYDSKGDFKVTCYSGVNTKKIQTLRNNLATRLKVDCCFGSQTQRATRMFQLCEALQDDGKIGNNTWSILETLNIPVPPSKKPPPPIPSTTVESDVKTANSIRINDLMLGIDYLKSLQRDLAHTSNNKNLLTLHSNTLNAMDTWLKAKISDNDFNATVQKAIWQLDKNYKARVQIGFPPKSDTVCTQKPCMVSGFGCTQPGKTVNICRGWQSKGINCRVDVLLHEFNHFIGIPGEEDDPVHQPDDALYRNAHHMASLVAALNSRPTKCCKKSC